jgi:hypothetical protein
MRHTANKDAAIKTMELEKEWSTEGINKLEAPNGKTKSVFLIESVKNEISNDPRV